MKVIIFFGLIGLISAQFGLGGWHPFHGTLPQKVVDFARATLRKMNMETTNFVTSDHDMQTQVVAGVNYKFHVAVGSSSSHVCTFNIYLDLMDNAHSNQDPICRAVKRQLGGFVAGGVAQVDVTDKGLQGAVNSASKSVNMMSNSINHMTVVHVSQATKQVIRGVKYTFNVDFQLADQCRNTEEHLYATLTECPPAKSSSTTSFHCVVIDVAWEKPRYKTECNMIHH